MKFLKEGYFVIYNKPDIQQLLEKSMPWVGMYIAAASAICTLAMAVDAFIGFRTKKLWFPCKYFSLNSTSLTLLAVAMKLPMDLTTPMLSNADWNAKITSLVFMSVAMGNFISSLGSMSDEEILTNVIALGILAVTIVADVWIQLIQLWPYLYFLGKMDILVPSILILILLATLVSSAVSLSTAKSKLELKYQEMHKIALTDEEPVTRVKFRIDVLRGEMMKYWVMAETGSPQFVVARSVICASSTALSLFAALRIPLYYIFLSLLKELGWFSDTESAYQIYPIWILTIQTIGVIIGAIKLILRWLVVVSFGTNSYKKEVKIETHWIQTLVDWRDSTSTSQIRNYKCRKYLHDAKRVVLNCCIGFQIFIVLVSKLSVFLTTLLMSPIFFCFTCTDKFKMQRFSKVFDSEEGMKSESDEDLLKLRPYILLLEGEAEHPMRTLKNICEQADKVIQTGKRNQPKNLINLLHKVVDFSGLREFDSNQVPSLRSQEPPNCWTLPVVTLTCIAVALPGIPKHKAKQLVSSVGEGLALAKMIEETLKAGELVNIRNASDVAWVEVAFYRNWLDINLLGISCTFKNSKQILQELSDKAERIVSKFKTEVKDFVMENPLNWPVRVIAANSMHRISQTIMLFCKEENEQTEEELFEQLSVMIADILAACLTNLPRVLTTMCHHKTIEKRGKNIHKAFLLLGQTEEIVDLLQKLQWPSMDPDKAVCIEEWRALLLEQHDALLPEQHDLIPTTSVSTSRNEIVNPVSNEESLVVIVDS